MKETLIIIDMQNDFIDGSLANPNAQEIVPKICTYLSTLSDKEDLNVVVTRDTHGEDYLNTPEGQKLPIVHCVNGTHGWEVNSDILDSITLNNLNCKFINKPTFGYAGWAHIVGKYTTNPPEKIYICGTVTSICVISNALILKALCPDTQIVVLEDLCADITSENHQSAINVMRACQIDVETTI